jgi:hypothetical protein
VFSLSILRVSSVKLQLIYCQLKWRHVSTHRVIIRPIIETCLRFIKYKSTFFGSQKLAFVLDVPQTWFSNWSDDDSVSRNMSPL